MVLTYWLRSFCVQVLVMMVVTTGGHERYYGGSNYETLHSQDRGRRGSGLQASGDMDIKCTNYLEGAACKDVRPM